jgi:hypothetical protein
MYDPNRHSFKLTSDAYERVRNLEVPVSGTSYVIKVGIRPVYLGAFWVNYSSLPWEGVAIMKPFKREAELRFESPINRARDPRTDTALIEILRKRGGR